MKLALIVFSILSVLLFGCNPMKSTATAEAAVAEFHARFDAQDFETVYSEAHPEFQKSQPKEELISFISSVARKLGSSEE